MHRCGTVTLGQSLRALVCAIRDDRDAHSFVHETLERNLRDVAGAEYHCSTAAESAKISSRAGRPPS